MSSVTVTMPYMASLTANHAYMNTRHGRILKPMVKIWRGMCAVMVKNELYRKPIAPPLRIRIDWQGPSEPDQDGRCKIIFDAIQIATGINDRNYIIMPGGFERKKSSEAEINITIEWEESDG